MKVTSASPTEDSVEAMLSLARILHANQATDQTMQSIADMARRAIPGCDSGSVTSVVEGRPETTVATSDLATALDQKQYNSGDGPCLQAVRTREVISVSSYEHETRWPEFSPAVREHGVGSSLSLPLIAGDDAIGALNLYSFAVDGFRGAGSVGGLFANHAAATLANATALDRATELALNLNIALERRDLIGQAKGILMAAQRISADEAFEVLRRASQSRNIKLHDLAVEIVERRGA